MEVLLEDVTSADVSPKPGTQIFSILAVLVRRGEGSTGEIITSVGKGLNARNSVESQLRSLVKAGYAVSGKGSGLARNWLPTLAGNKRVDALGMSHRDLLNGAGSPIQEDGNGPEVTDEEAFPVDVSHVDELPLIQFVEGTAFAAAESLDRLRAEVSKAEDAVLVAMEAVTLAEAEVELSRARVTQRETFLQMLHEFGAEVRG